MKKHRLDQPHGFLKKQRNKTWVRLFQKKKEKVNRQNKKGKRGFNLIPGRTIS